MHCMQHVKRPVPTTKSHWHEFIRSLKWYIVYSWFGVFRLWQNSEHTETIAVCVSRARATIPNEWYVQSKTFACDSFFCMWRTSRRSARQWAKWTIMQSTVRPANRSTHIVGSARQKREKSKEKQLHIEAPVAAVHNVQYMLCSSSALSYTKSHTTGFSLSRIAIAAARGCYSQQ